MLTLIGGAMLLMGMVSGVLLLLPALGVMAAAPGLATWAMFPLLSAAGYILLAQAARRGGIAMLSTLAGGALLLLGLAALVVIFLHANGLLEPKGDGNALWYVMVTGFVLGGIGFGVRGYGKDAAAG